jgi:dTDP-glucose 4,6-dehydratase
LANIVENFKPGETYNIGGKNQHTIEELSDAILKVTGADPSLAVHRDSEILTTHHKRVDVSKALRDLAHQDTYSLEDGIRMTAEWMQRVYNLETRKLTAQSFGG